MRTRKNKIQKTRKNRNSKNRNNKNRNRKNKTKAKGLTRNLRETKTLIKKLPLSEDLSKEITKRYVSDLISSRVYQYNYRKLLIEKIDRYILIVNEIIYKYMEYNGEMRTYNEAQEILSDFGYDYISKIESLKDKMKELKSKAKKDVTKEYMNSINRLLNNYYREINLVSQSEFEKGQYSDILFIRKLDNFLDNRENQND